MPAEDQVQLNHLQRNILTLANVEEADERVVSCYLDLGTRYREDLNDWVRLLGNRLERRLRLAFWEALGRIEVFVGTGIRPESRGAAAFARGGARPFFLGLQFDTSLPTRVTVGASPHIYSLVELEHDYSGNCVGSSRGSRAEITERESPAPAQRLHDAMVTSGLAVAGTLDSFRVLKLGRGSLLVISRSYTPDPGWSCCGCGELTISFRVPPGCSACGHRSLRELNVKEELVRIAEQQRCPIRIVEHCDKMKAIGGVGCIVSRPIVEQSGRPAA
jgi:hypothetical protein